MLNWKIRYAKLIAKYPDLLDPRHSVLELGSGAYGIATYLNRPVVGVEPAPVTPMVQGLEIRQATIEAIPFPDNFFDFVVCVDVLEHLYDQQRIPAIKEMLRVSRKYLLLSCPTKYYGEFGESELAAWFDRRYGQSPPWLQEHLVNGLPDVSDLIKAVADFGFPFEVFGNEGMLQHFAGILLDHELPFTQRLLAAHDIKTVREAPIQASEWDLFYSYAFAIEKGEAKATSACLQPYAKAPVTAPVVYAICHCRSLLPPCGDVTPLWTGSAAKEAGFGEITDQMQSESELLNSRWSELSGIYKIWKEGPVSSVVGFCHYRRFFNFSDAPTDPQRSEIRLSDTENYQSNFYSEIRLSSCLDRTVILPRPFQLDESPFQNYARVHQANDLCLLITLISRHAPELLPYMDNLLTGRSIYAFNMFAMKWSLFNELCSIWFFILRRFEEEVAPARASSYQNRDISFLAERLFDIWIRYATSRHNLRIQEVPIYFVNE